MDPDRWRRIEELYHAAQPRGAGDRAAFLVDACAGDTALRQEVESLLAQPVSAEAFLRAPAMARAAQIVAEQPHSMMTGRRLGAYELQGLLGAGGMGEVYRARDTKLGREVAIKILPRAFTSDPERLARFEREARMLAALNHPHIGAIYGLEEFDPSPYSASSGQAGSGQMATRGLVLELVEGPTLADRLAVNEAGTPLPIHEALEYARQIAEALEAAHEKGIVHRDLKPANIKITLDGVVKVLDFGLAKAGSGEASEPDLTQSPTMTIGGTREGMILGTAAYMSPDQARGKPVDKRTDIWAFGCVLFEMLAARVAFAGATITDTLAAILEREPDWNALPAPTPITIRRLLQRCLEKDPKRRLHDIADARIELEDALRTPAPETQAAAPPRRRDLRLAALAAVLTAIAAGAVATTMYVRGIREVSGPTRLSISVPGQVTPQLSAAVSPEGRRVAFVSTDASGRSMLWIRDLDSLEPRALAGTEDAAHPFWSPDGHALGFMAGGKVKRVEAAGGPVQTLADTTTRLGATWSRDGVILFSPRLGQFATIPANGGSISPLAVGGRWPSFLPDGRHFLYLKAAGPEGSGGVYVGSLDSQQPKRVQTTQFKAAYAPPGYLLFVREQTLLAQPFDGSRFELRGEPVVVAEGIWGAPLAGQASFSVSPAGVLAYVNASLSNTQLFWFDRDGRLAGSVGPAAEYGNQTPQLSPDAARLAIARGLQTSSGVWLFDLRGTTTTRLTLNSGSGTAPVWSGDGARIVFQSRRSDGPGRNGLYMRNANGAGSEEVLLELAPSTNIALWDWSTDGRFLVYSSWSVEKSIADLWVLPLVGDRKPYPFLTTPFHKTQAQVSPNRRWLAYTSYESGKDEVYVESFPLPGNKRQISADGGVMPRWRRDGTELFYLAGDQYLMALPVKGETVLETGRAARLFKTKIIPQGSQSAGLAAAGYDVTPDGQRFLLNVPPDDPGPPITVVLNWQLALGARESR